MVGDRAQEVDPVAHARRRCDGLQAIHLALVSVPAVLAEDQQAHVVVLAIPKECEGPDRDLDALQALEPADEEQESSGTVADLAPRLGAVDRLEHR